ncbi:hypothetical protein N9N71_01420, partial [Synechococcus sp. AH-229-G18]|nr:hypothetical protein [Synechococcus sp. AH-229-G18]
MAQTPYGGDSIQDQQGDLEKLIVPNEKEYKPTKSNSEEGGSNNQDFDVLDPTLDEPLTAPPEVEVTGDISVSDNGNFISPLGLGGSDSTDDVPDAFFDPTPFGDFLI